jgi:hypothetical protein
MSEVKALPSLESVRTLITIALRYGERRDVAGLKRIKRIGCGGSIRSRFNPSVTIALTA